MKDKGTKTPVEITGTRPVTLRRNPRCDPLVVVRRKRGVVINALPESVTPWFRAAGWFPGRRAWFTWCRGLKRLCSFSLGAALIHEFGGLRVGRVGPGEECATSDLQFHRCPSDADRYSVAELEAPGDDLFPLGLAHRGYMELFIDRRGRLWVYGVPDGSLAVAGETFGAGVERLLLARKWPEVA